jgi:putative MATE family efflux protein
MSEELVTEHSLKQNTEFLKGTFLKSVFPCMLTILSVNINVFVDGILVGNRIGADALAAINLSLPLYLMLCVVGSFFASGTAINAAREIGNNEVRKSQEYYRTCVVSTFLASVLITLAGLVFKEPLVSFLCSDEQIRPYVMEYTVITLIGALPKIMIYVPFWYLRLDGKNIAVTVMMSVMSVGNVLLDILFVYVYDLGVFGAGLASVIATTAAFAIGVIWLLRKDSSFTFKPYIHKKLSEWKEIAAAGTPSALNNLFSTIRLLLINRMLMRYGGGTMVAVFTAVNGIAGFGECITLGIPQAASAMLGVYSGEKDNGSCALLVKLEWFTGCVFAGIFLVVCMAGAGAIQKIYGLTESLFVPLLWMAVSVFPALFCNILSGYYNMAKKNMWSNAIIFLRVIAMTYIGLILTIHLNLSVYSFLFFAEAATVVIWFLATGVNHRIYRENTRYLLMDTSLERTGKVLNFSVDSDVENICNASERIMEFCQLNGMNHKKTMRIQLAMEEIMTLIAKVNEENGGEALNFDLRAYSLDGFTGIRIRYAGKEFNPFRDDRADDDMYMGIMMIKKMVEITLYQRTFGVNTLQVVLSEE